jgi:thiamine-monophosphate kinase
MADLTEIGEFGLIERIKARKTAHSEDVVLGIGDDCAVLRRGSVLEVLTTDCLVEGSHYQGAWLSIKDVGWKALAVNVSDVAAMGGVPKHALVTLFLPDNLKTADIDEIYDGIEQCGEQFGVTVVGGDIVRIEGPFAISITLSGVCERDELVLRSGARPQDIIVVTGCLGEAAAGLRCMKQKRRVQGGDSIAGCIRRFQHPWPRFKESRTIVHELQPSSMIDLSDGLLSDLWHILEASNVGAVLDADNIPVGQCVIDLFGGNRAEALSLALSGGEDYELLFTVSARVANKIPEISAKAGLEMTAVGKITGKGSGVRLAGAEGQRELSKDGFDHFRRTA